MRLRWWVSKLLRQSRFECFVFDPQIVPSTGWLDLPYVRLHRLRLYRSSAMTIYSQHRPPQNERCKDAGMNQLQMNVTWPLKYLEMPYDASIDSLSRSLSLSLFLISSAPSLRPKDKEVVWSEDHKLGSWISVRVMVGKRYLWVRFFGGLKQVSIVGD